MDLTLEQLAVTSSPLDAKIFLSGPAGTGKTSAAVGRLRFLLNEGVRADSILLLTPQRYLHEPYLRSLELDPYAGGEVASTTVGGLARRMADLFWPAAAETAGFAHPDQPPVFLNLETAQYYMAHIVRPLLDEGYFESVTIDRNRLYSQILDNLNKAAVIGFPYTEIAARLDAAYYGDPAQRRVYADAQDCANRFRQYCLEHNLLDFSLQMEILTNTLWPQEEVRSYLSRTYRHLVYDNPEEDGPRAHDLVREWLEDFQSALLVYDEGGGYRYFLGADPRTAWALRELCSEQAIFADSFVISPEIANLSESLSAAIAPSEDTLSERIPVGKETLTDITRRFYPELLDAIAAEIRVLITENVTPASEIVILAPYLSDALRFSITNRLDALDIPWRSHRPSRSLRDEPASHALLTLAALAHPDWDIRPPKFDVAYALMQSIEGLDLVRAQLLAEIIYRPRDLLLASFDGIKPDVQERITFSIGLRYSTLHDWILEYRSSEPLSLDHFLRRLFGEVLSQPGFAFRSHLDSIRVAASLIESIKRFRQATESTQVDFRSLGREYIAMLQDGVIAAQYLEGWQAENEDAVLVAPAHTFLMMNRPAAYQFWLDAGSSGWYERLAQPLTHPYVLSRGWPPGQVWTDADELQTAQQAMARLVTGLLHRCRERVYIGLSELGESGFEQRGELLRAFQRVLENAEEPE
jgi:hypothetical protein